MVELSIMYHSLSPKRGDVKMDGKPSSGYLKLMQQREAKNKRLEGLTYSNYFREMEDIRNGREPSNFIKQYILRSNN